MMTEVILNANHVITGDSEALLTITKDSYIYIGYRGGYWDKRAFSAANPCFYLHFTLPNHPNYHSLGGQLP
jgi:hypothetical protein